MSLNKLNSTNEYDDVISNQDGKFMFLHKSTNKVGLCWPGIHGETVSGTRFLEKGSKAYDLVSNGSSDVHQIFEVHGKDFVGSVLPKVSN